MAQGSSPDDVFLDRVRLVGNQSAIKGGGSPAVVVLNNSTLFNNSIAIDTVDGNILSFQSNARAGNGSDGQKMTPIGLK